MEESMSTRKLFEFRFQPTSDLWMVGISWLLVVASLSAATFIATPARGGFYFILYALVGATLFGVGLPVWWMVWRRGRPIADLGVTTRLLGLSLLLQVVFAAIQYVFTLSRADIPATSTLLPLIALALAIGFFEALFWRGWVQLRLEESFGLLPGIILGSALYALYHIGYGMTWGEMGFLFLIGLIYASIFRLTKNIFILWPLLQPMGQLTTLLNEGLPLPSLAILGFLEALALMIAIVIVVPRLYRRRKMRQATLKVS
jgi:membrane protease YdiL (CAAX protease family)